MPARGRNVTQAKLPRKEQQQKAVVAVVVAVVVAAAVGAVLLLAAVELPLGIEFECRVVVKVVQGFVCRLLFVYVVA